ncbi:hypothetical protein PPTG_23907 [Phytophthora nicotianae INRA-310]|uniref:Uncharacterized protein n=1 Tax=Phytophthora nicotianae (strain INRA-310) TaxID=761204 RepID=W2PP17_PHYN3|nr:hypothetical protein PPTG_23907 [Phytophthora nicotianae INRA-310]ETN02617.1 hypothetical protein PPTG_23907 [Phytophthora nicotianae INRA-310]
MYPADATLARGKSTATSKGVSIALCRWKEAVGVASGCTRYCEAVGEMQNEPPVSVGHSSTSRGTSTARFCDWTGWHELSSRLLTVLTRSKSLIPQRTKQPRGSKLRWGRYPHRIYPHVHQLSSNMTCGQFENNR